MTFIDLLNEHVLLLALSLTILIFLGLRLAITQGGFGRHLAYSWSLIVYTIYVLISPFYFFNRGTSSIIGTDISKYYGLGFFFNNVAILCFILGYWAKGKSTDKVWNAPPYRNFKKKSPHFLIKVLFYGLYAIVLLNLAMGGANIQNVFLGDEVLGMGASGASYFLQNFTDSLICVIVLAYLFDIPGRTLVLWIVAAFFLFSLLGFRYRIMLSLIGILFVYLYKSKLNAKKVVIGLGLGLIFFYGVMFSTENRRALIYRDYTNMAYDPLTFNYENFFMQTRGALPDMAVYKLYDNPNKQVDHDYGLTMFGYVFIRMIPRTIMPDKDKFYPPPQLATVTKAYDAYWAAQSGEATLSVAAFYIAFGWLGVVFGHFFWGLLIRNYGDGLRKADKLHLATYIAIALATFQWISRGYFPQIIDHAVYLLIPIWVMRFFTKKTVVNADHQHS